MQYFTGKGGEYCLLNQIFKKQIDHDNFNWWVNYMNIKNNCLLHYTWKLAMANGLSNEWMWEGKDNPAFDRTNIKDSRQIKGTISLISYFRAVSHNEDKP